MISRLFSHICILCRRNAQQNKAICVGCEQDLPWVGSVCLMCGNILPMNIQNQRCGQCLQSLPPYQKTFVLFEYGWPIDYLIMGLKFSRRLEIAQLLGQLMAEKWIGYYGEHAKPEVIIPIPLHIRRLQTRGYNQALELARPLAAKLNIPIDSHCAQRRCATLAQAEIPASERQQNVKNAFYISPTVRYRHVAVLDDVVTTGSTMSEFCRQLQKQGVTNIDVWCCARPPYG